MSIDRKKFFLGINHSVLFLCTSVYLGTGWSLVLFSFPIAPELTPDNYYMQFVPQVTAATNFFTYMTMVMIASAVVMIVAEWRSYLRWFPIGVLLGVVLATALTMIFIIPYNEQMSAGIKDAAVLREVLDKWMNLNVVRVCLWTFQWLCMMAFFFIKYVQSTTAHRAIIARHRKAKIAL
jgi:hypothetical protein